MENWKSKDFGGVCGGSHGTSCQISVLPASARKAVMHYFAPVCCCMVVIVSEGESARCRQPGIALLEGCTASVLSVGRTTDFTRDSRQQKMVV